MITFVVQAKAHMHTCKWNGKNYQSNHKSAISDIARQLKADACPNQSWQVVWFHSPEKVTMRGINLDWLADHVLIESATQRIRWARYEPFPKGAVHAARA